MHDRRRSQRMVADQEIYARIKSSIPVRIVDLSRHGMQVEATSALPPSGECDIWLPTDGGDIRTRVRVQRCRARFVQTKEFKGLMYQAGVEFLDLDQDAKSALDAIIKRLAGNDVDPEDLKATIENTGGQEQPESSKMWRAV
jgi:hypothetical protein